MVSEKVAWSPLGGFSPTGGPTIEDLSRCVHCGLCLNACPTQRVTGLETESPRGRIYLMRAVRDGRIDITESFFTHMDQCLVCRSCETACPSGVQFGRLMEATRAELWNEPVGSRRQRLALKLAFEAIFPRRKLFRLVFRGLHIYQQSGLQRLLRRTGLLHRLSTGLAERERLTPALRGAFFDDDTELPARIPGRPRVGFVAGCIMSTAFGDVQRASVRVLEAFGCQVVTPTGQGCCGALNVHAGERTHAKRMARALIERMLRADVDVVVINSAGCGSVMKEYVELFADEPDFLPLVRLFTGKVKDFSEYLADLPAFRDGSVSLEAPKGAHSVVYQDACHLRHAQKITSQPRALLSAIAGVRLVELSLPDQCCGSAGVYNLLHPELSNRILADKIDDVLATGASRVVTCNPGCLIQIEKGLRERGAPVEVQHIATVLDEALTGEPA